MKLKVVIFLASVLGVTEACNKLVKIPPPITSVTTETVFSSDTTAYSAIAAIYDDMSWHGASTDWANSIIANEAGMSADEMNDGYGAGDWFLSNSLFASASPAGQFWIAPYFDIYMANGVLEGLNASTKVTAGVRNQLEGEAKFLRALAYFYLTNLFGDLPLVLSTDFHKTALLHKSTQAQIYQQIVADLKDAQGLLPSDYSVYNSQRIRATKWAATALLARTYLYIDSFANAAAESSAVINNTALFGLDSLNGVFLTNSQESILQLATQDFYPYSTQEAQLAIPPCSTCSPIFYLTSQLVSAFEPGDQRWTDWVDSTVYNGVTYYYPFKYKVYIGSQGNETEAYNVLRLGEQYLIRAEAEANGAGGGLGAAIADINIIRNRAGLGSLAATLPQPDVMAAIQQERRIELFSEWGHRWFDLKRWGIAVAALDTISYKRGHMNNTQLLYPIPISEIQDDPNLTQNPGY